VLWIETYCITLEYGITGVNNFKLTLYIKSEQREWLPDHYMANNKSEQREWLPDHYMANNKSEQREWLPDHCMANNKSEKRQCEYQITT